MIMIIIITLPITQQLYHSSCTFITDLHPLEVDGIHDGALEEFHGGEVPLEQSFQLQIWRLPAITLPLTFTTKRSTNSIEGYMCRN